MDRISGPNRRGKDEYEADMGLVRSLKARHRELMAKLSNLFDRLDALILEAQALREFAQTCAGKTGDIGDGTV
jgi:hypothetical protein